MDIQLSNWQKVAVLIAVLLAIFGGLFAAVQVINHSHHVQKQEACAKANQYHQERPGSSHILTINDAICGNS